jgi:pilus assembly protein CpaC
MSGRGAAVLLAVVLLGGPAWADPPATSTQIQLDVLVARLKPEAWDALKGALGRSAVPGEVKGEGAFVGVLRPEQGEIVAIIEKLEKRGLAKNFARPRLVTLSGRPASFRDDGGEPVVPVPAGRGSVGVQFEEFGTRLNFLPTVLGNGRIRLEAEPEVWILDAKAESPIVGATVPGRTVRRVLVTTELDAGQTLVVAVRGHGTITEREFVPALRGLPYIRHLFSREVTHEADYQLLVVVVPRVIAPTAVDNHP